MKGRRGKAKRGRRKEDGNSTVPGKANNMKNE
eukprot:CAMPEP_0194747016 /NCGR_PEP_ID=MMETSP0323_2-20130528/1082_1 /TAXON_ID=2866 ORGANISM="Crypthecodinium cohnii, Strain Seligo" /NCGR_SAMPLE_ID=MMETSP0323_2 /ASSEMBLY_ACC=CAM_ASM_000346 /LENGTH=31 /DNA_ID= /DNA_START= /DNA_END= /DNA_ORIENTATION=